MPADPAQCCDSGAPVPDDTEGLELPSFPGGEDAMREWVSRNLKYPMMAQDAGIMGTSWVEFRVACDGSVQKVSLVQGPSALLDSAALHTIRQMPPWSPGRLNGSPVCVRHVLPVKFVLR